MAVSQSSYRGCLLGLAVGDAMGYTVDNRGWQEIQEDYGPNGLLGYDLVNGYADVTSYTQLAAFTCNGLLFGLTRGQMLGKMAPFIKYVGMSSREWAASQRPWGRPTRNYCWLLRRPDLCRRHCMDTRMLDTLSRPTLGTPETPANNYDGPGGITTAIGVGLFFHEDRTDQHEIDLLGAEAVALTQGSPSAFLSGAVLAHIMSRLIRQPHLPLKRLVAEAVEAMKEQFGHQYSQAFEVATLVRHAITYSESPNLSPVDVMERLGCDSAAQVLAGAVYTCLTNSADFDSAMIAAVNHSGRRALHRHPAGCQCPAELHRAHRHYDRPPGAAFRRHSGGAAGGGSPAGLLYRVPGACGGPAGAGGRPVHRLSHGAGQQAVRSGLGLQVPPRRAVNRT